MPDSQLAGINCYNRALKLLSAGIGGWRKGSRERCMAKHHGVDGAGRYMHI